jgi:hypothetical protein
MFIPHLVDLEKVVAKNRPSVDFSQKELKRHPHKVAEHLWGMVLLPALKDKATEVVVDPSNVGHELGYRIDGNYYELLPPPISALCDFAETVRRWGKPRSLRRRFANFDTSTGEHDRQA